VVVVTPQPVFGAVLQQVNGRVGLIINDGALVQTIGKIDIGIVHGVGHHVAALASREIGAAFAVMLLLSLHHLARSLVVPVVAGIKPGIGQRVQAGSLLHILVPQNVGRGEDGVRELVDFMKPLSQSESYERLP